jgi:hypothetical protein
MELRIWLVAKYEIKKLVRIRGKRYNDYMPCGLNIRDKLWWWLMPGVIIKVRWPKGMIVVDHDDPRWYDVGATRVEIESADPNDHYRPTMERLIGRQKWHWDWGFVGNDVNDNCLTIKIARSRAKYATLLALQWS